MTGTDPSEKGPRDEEARRGSRAWFIYWVAVMLFVVVWAGAMAMQSIAYFLYAPVPLVLFLRLVYRVAFVAALVSMPLGFVVLFYCGFLYDQEPPAQSEDVPAPATWWRRLLKKIYTAALWILAGLAYFALLMVAPILFANKRIDDLLMGISPAVLLVGVFVTYIVLPWWRDGRSRLE